MSNTNLNSSVPDVVDSVVSSVLDDEPDTPVLLPKVFVPSWKGTGRRSDGKQAAKAPVVAAKAKATSAKPSAASAKSGASSGASSGSRKPYQPQKTVRFCRFEDHQYDREEKTWVPSQDGTLRMCPDKDCTFTHRVARPNPCPVGDGCADHECKLLHSKQRPKPCRFGENCINEKCGFSHPSARRQPCPNGANCYEHAYEVQRGDEDEEGPGCPHGHPRRMTRVCQHNQNCRRFECNFLHAPDAPRDCPEGSQCQLQWQAGGVIPRDQVCGNKHPRHTRVVEDSNGNFRFM